MGKTAYLLLGVFFALAAAARAQEASNSFYETGPEVRYEAGVVTVEGEVENPGPVDLTGLPLRQAAVREVAWEDGEAVFKGAHFYSGYSLYDILRARPVRKARDDFRPETDLFVTVENAAGDKAVFSWGEIYYAADGFGALIAASARSVTAPKRKTEKDWPLPPGPRLVAPRDLYNCRFIAAPSKITVRSLAGDFPGEKHEPVYAPAFSVTSAGGTFEVKGPGKAGVRTYEAAGYGHGTGFKGMKKVEGFLFKDVLARAGVSPRESGSYLVSVSAGDAYRAAFSLAELINRGDNADFLVVDNGRAKDGRFSLFSPADFFVDRNVRGMSRVGITRP
ncbi:MAG TPA: hypothetical protein PK523_03110 [Elusimicrobiales bacterium]|nr:hypothetical protein [Elusimicrobiales bacterium]